MEYKELRKQFETEKQYPSWNCNDTVIMEYIEWLEQQLKNCFIPDVVKSLAPHLCPVCKGNGLVPNGFYMQTSGHWSTSSITPEKCRSCNGTGIVWG
jgi:hypothetical protein